MGLLTTIKSLGCKHSYKFDDVFPTEHRPGTLLVIIKCDKCGKTDQIFHDLTETERPVFRQPHVEEMLFKLGYLTTKKNGEIVFNPKTKKR